MIHESFYRETLHHFYILPPVHKSIWAAQVLPRYSVEKMEGIFYSNGKPTGFQFCLK